MANYTGWQSPGYSNDNLLKNWDFRQPVNQRGQTEYTGYGYCIDMWILDDTTLTIKDGYISTTYNNSDPAKNQMIQRTEITRGNINYTMSVALKNGEYYIASGKPSDIVSVYFGDGNAIAMVLENNKIVVNIAFYNAAIDILAAKLEVGTVSTLALDLMQPPNYAAQLRECQRYYQKGSACVAVYSKANYANDGAFTSYVNLGNMRIQPTVTLSKIWVPGYYDVTLIDQSKFVVQPYITQDSAGFYVAVLKQDIFDNILGRCLALDYEASAEL